MRDNFSDCSRTTLMKHTSISLGQIVRDDSPISVYSTVSALRCRWTEVIHACTQRCLCFLPETGSSGGRCWPSGGGPDQRATSACRLGNIFATGSSCSGDGKQR